MRSQFVPMSISGAGLISLFFVSSCTILASCSSPPEAARVDRPSLAPPFAATLSLDDVAAFTTNDPDLCTSEKDETLGGLSSRAVYHFETRPNVDSLYARIIVSTKVCTASSLSTLDKTALSKVLNALKIADARTFAATISVTGNGQGGIKYPQLAPFNYAYDESKSTYAVQTIGKAALPWQVTSSFEIQYSYNSSKSLSVNTASLFSGIVTSIAGAGGTSALLSPAANAYLSTGQSILQNIATSMFSATNSSGDSYHFDVLAGPDRALAYRFRDLSSRPMAAVRLEVLFTSSIQNPVPIEPTSAIPTPPQFTGLQDILGVSVGGPLMGTLGDAVSKEASYQDLLKSNVDTSVQSFASSCDHLEQALQSKYGLNKYDTALAMGEVLSQNTPYLSSKKLYSSGCFRGRGVLKVMGIGVFEQAPST
jgi:hypothetical protein